MIIRSHFSAFEHAKEHNNDHQNHMHVYESSSFTPRKLPNIKDQPSSNINILQKNLFVQNACSDDN
jgi:hypothetical protein